MTNVCTNAQVRLHFNNQLTIITKTDDTAAIMFDGQAVTTQTQWRKASNWGYSYAAFPVTHGAHFITVTRGSAATFGAYSYGHSLIDTSSSAYGMTVGFHGRNVLLFGCDIAHLYSPSAAQAVLETLQWQIFPH